MEILKASFRLCRYCISRANPRNQKKFALGCTLLGRAVSPVPHFQVGFAGPRLRDTLSFTAVSVVLV